MRKIQNLDLRIEHLKSNLKKVSLAIEILINNIDFHLYQDNSSISYVCAQITCFVLLSYRTHHSHSVKRYIVNRPASPSRRRLFQQIVAFSHRRHSRRCVPHWNVQILYKRYSSPTQVTIIIIIYLNTNKIYQSFATIA